MSHHAVSAEPGGYTFSFSISRKWFRMAGACAFAAGVVIAVLAAATEPFRVPLGIAVGVLTMTLLVAFAVKSPSRAQKPEPGLAPVGGRRPIALGTLRAGKSVATELALLAELHAKGALTDEEFSAAKLRTLGE